MNDELRQLAQQVAYEALEIETGGLGPSMGENCGQYLTRMAAGVVRHLDLAGYLNEKPGPGRPQIPPKPKAAKPRAKKKA